SDTSPSASAAARLLARVAPNVAKYTSAWGRQTGRPISTTTASGRAASSARTTRWATGYRCASRTTISRGRPDAAASTPSTAAAVASLSGAVVLIRCALPADTHRLSPHGTVPTAMFDGGTISP